MTSPELVRSFGEMKPVKVYLTEWCPFCIRARRLLESKGIAYEAIDVDGDLATRRWLREVTGQRTVPQIFIGDEPIGGFTELHALDQSGALDLELAS